jgi:hypothetical protein
LSSLLNVFLATSASWSEPWHSIYSRGPISGVHYIQALQSGFPLTEGADRN